MKCLVGHDEPFEELLTTFDTYVSQMPKQLLLDEANLSINAVNHISRLQYQELFKNYSLLPPCSSSSKSNLVRLSKQEKITVEVFYFEFMFSCHIPIFMHYISVPSIPSIKIKQYIHNSLKRSASDSKISFIKRKGFLPDEYALTAMYNASLAEKLPPQWLTVFFHWVVLIGG